MNNNRGNNNRRRGRGNNNNNGNRPQNGGQQINRIDSRARGNAPQMLEKYRKLAQDAHLNGDRVQAEYYLQFADHYFRVTADTRVRQEEARLRQNGGQPYAPGFATGGSVSGDNWQDQDGEDDSMEFGGNNDFPSFDRAPQQPRRDDRDTRDFRDQRPRVAEPSAGEVIPPEGLRVVEGEPVTPVSDNPFVRDARNPRDRNDRRGARRADGDAPRPQRSFVREVAPAAEPAPRFDPSSLPPAIGVRSDTYDEAPARAAPADDTAAPDAAAAPKKRGRPRKNPLPVADD